MALGEQFRLFLDGYTNFLCESILSIITVLIPWRLIGLAIKDQSSSGLMRLCERVVPLHPL